MYQGRLALGGKDQALEALGTTGAGSSSHNSSAGYSDRQVIKLQSIPMSTAEKVAKGSLGVGLGEVIEKGSMFLRNLILARLLAPSDFGLGSTFVTTYLLFLMISSFSTSQYIVQSDSGEDESLQNSVHTVELLRGIFSALLIFVSAGWVSSLFGVPEVKWAFQMLALIPLMLGLVHTDIFRFQRKMRFTPSIITAVVSDLVALVAAYPAAIYFGNYTACLVCLLLKICSYMVLSHFLARRRFRLGVDLHFLKDLWFFGWPLLLNGGLMFITLQGDRFIIGSGKQLFPGSIFTLADLGAFSVAFSFTWIPTLMVIKVMNKVVLPYLSQVKKNPGEFSFRLFSFYPFLAIYSTGILAVFVLGGGVIISFFCGEEYLVDDYLIIWLAAANSIRVFRSLTGMGLMAIGDTRNFLNISIIRSTAFLATLFISASGLYLGWIGFAVFTAELASLIYVLYLVNKRHSISIKKGLPCLSVLPVMIPLLLTVNHFIGPYDGMVLERMIAAVVVMGLVTVSISVLMGATYRKNLIQMFRNLRNEIKIKV